MSYPHQLTSSSPQKPILALPPTLDEALPRRLALMPAPSNAWGRPIGYGHRTRPNIDTLALSDTPKQRSSETWHLGWSNEVVLASCKGLMACDDPVAALLILWPPGKYLRCRQAAIDILTGGLTPAQRALGSNLLPTLPERPPATSRRQPLQGLLKATPAWALVMAASDATKLSFLSRPIDVGRVAVLHNIILHRGYL